MFSDEAEMALEEMKILQEVIQRHEGHAMKVKGWLLAITAGFIAVIYTDKVTLHWLLVWMASLLVVLAFHYWASHHYLIAQLAINRCKELESALRLEAAGRVTAERYGGFNICETLAEKPQLMGTWTQARKPWNVASFVAVCIIVTLVSVSYGHKNNQLLNNLRVCVENSCIEFFSSPKESATDRDYSDTQK